MSNEFALRQYTLPLPQPFEASESLQDFGTPKPGFHHDESWPVLYILTNSKNKTAYIGQTTNYRRRMKQHAANVDKDFDRTLLIDNPTFNQSATFEFENRLIELFCADEKYQVTNANNGYAQFDYFERPQYRQKFRDLWTKLREENYAIHPIEELENTDLFKFSPFKTLTPDQYETIEAIYRRLEQEHEDIKHGGPKKERVTVVNGAPGTGKTILAISLMFKIKNEPNLSGLRVGFVTPMESLSKTLKKLTHFLPGLKPGDILSPNDVTKTIGMTSCLSTRRTDWETTYPPAPASELSTTHVNDSACRARAARWIGFSNAATRRTCSLTPNSKSAHRDSTEMALSSDSTNSKKPASRPKNST